MTDPATVVCRALSHPVRRALLRAMARQECDVGQLGGSCGLDQPTVSKHLAVLRRAGLVQVRVVGRYRCYLLAQEDVVRPLLELLDQFQQRTQSQDPVPEGLPAPGQEFHRSG